MVGTTFSTTELVKKRTKFFFEIALVSLEQRKLYVLVCNSKKALKESLSALN